MAIHIYSRCSTLSRLDVSGDVRFPNLSDRANRFGQRASRTSHWVVGFIFPFDAEAMSWATSPTGLFRSLNISALSPTLIESELFGHTKGSFTGAVEDRTGWLESCPRHGAVFIDELGELDPKIQVKLLRVFEDRTFQRLGETTTRRFQGRIIAATNRDMSEEVLHKRFRSDLYYRLCADRITTPSLSDRCNDNHRELAHLVGHLMRRITVVKSDELASQCVEWIRENLPSHGWPGNVRELEQCVRSWLLRKDYQPLDLRGIQTPDRLEESLAKSSLSAEELVSLYCRVKYRQTESYVKTAAALQLDRRTVKSRVTR